ncbi:hypothetical protein F5144DRAFT_225654 [Chaetomium tenue]|uniref:Uncharacterized protein n=1 Tax=Chaetomium tenue TaxID=1854479 RepID=A0ACB7P685_9PEZI|nr:hypothetical protein F5144DRAFT_225654 [Chaetomium globosum]
MPGVPGCSWLLLLVPAREGFNSVCIQCQSSRTECANSYLHFCWLLVTPRHLPHLVVDVPCVAFCCATAAALLRLLLLPPRLIWTRGPRFLRPASVESFIPHKLERHSWEVSSQFRTSCWQLSRAHPSS